MGSKWVRWGLSLELVRTKVGRVWRLDVKDRCCGIWIPRAAGKVLRRAHDTFAPTLKFKWGVNRWAVGKAGLTLADVGVGRVSDPTHDG